MSSVRLAVDARRARDSEEVEWRSDLRFAAMKRELPSRGVVGYVGEPDAAAWGDYYLAQYALAPVVVERSANHTMVVGNFRSEAAAQAAVDSARLELVRNFGGGVVLLANKDAQ